MTNPGGNKSKEIQTLIQNMEAFNEVTAQLQNSYDELQGRVKKLDLELSDKNDELEKNLAEKERVKNYVNDNKEAITGYIMQMSEYFHNKDKGIEEIKPECPQEIQIELGCME